MQVHTLFQYKGSVPNTQDCVEKGACPIQLMKRYILLADGADGHPTNDLRLSRVVIHQR